MNEERNRKIMIAIESYADYTEVARTPKFHVGDIIQCVDRGKSYEITIGQNYIVMDWKPGTGSDDLIKIRPDKSGYANLSNWFTSKRFILVTSNKGSKMTANTLPAKLQKYLVLHNGIVVMKHDSIEDVKEYVQMRLRKEPVEQFHVYAYETTGQLPSVPVEWGSVKKD
jgi:hypothetical protein